MKWNAINQIFKFAFVWREVYVRWPIERRAHTPKNKVKLINFQQSWRKNVNTKRKESKRVMTKRESSLSKDRNERVESRDDIIFALLAVLSSRQQQRWHQSSPNESRQRKDNTKFRWNRSYPVHIHMNEVSDFTRLLNNTISWLSRLLKTFQSSISWARSTFSQLAHRTYAALHNQPTYNIRIKFKSDCRARVVINLYWRSMKKKLKVKSLLSRGNHHSMEKSCQWSQTHRKHWSLNE